MSCTFSTCHKDLQLILSIHSNIPKGTSREKSKGLFIVREPWLPDIEIPTLKKNPSLRIEQVDANDEQGYVDENSSDVEDDWRSTSANKRGKVVTFKFQLV